MANQNFEHVVLAFLQDRLAAGHLSRVGLSRLIDSPNVGDGLENHLRAAALVGCKRSAWHWLAMQLVPVDDGAVPEAAWLQSAKDWTKQPLDVGAFRATAVNAFGQPIFESARHFERGTLSNGDTRTMLAGVDDAGIERAGRAAGETIWIVEGAGLKCVEGNARMHALALGLVRGTLSEAQAEAWWMWVGR